MLRSNGVATYSSTACNSEASQCATFERKFAKRHCCGVGSDRAETIQGCTCPRAGSKSIYGRTTTCLRTTSLGKGFASSFMHLRDYFTMRASCSRRRPCSFAISGFMGPVGGRLAADPCASARPPDPGCAVSPRRGANVAHIRRKCASDEGRMANGCRPLIKHSQNGDVRNKSPREGRCYGSLPMNSPPALVNRARRAFSSVFSLMKRTEPSRIRALKPSRL